MCGAVSIVLCGVVVTAEHRLAAQSNGHSYAGSLFCYALLLLVGVLLYVGGVFFLVSLMIDLT